MWVVTLERHNKYILHKTTTIDVKHWLPAYLIYQLFKFCWLMSSFPVKQVSLYRFENGVVYLEGSRLKVLEGDQLRRLKCAKRRSKC